MIEVIILRSFYRVGLVLSNYCYVILSAARKFTYFITNVSHTCVVGLEYSAFRKVDGIIKFKLKNEYLLYIGTLFIKSVNIFIHFFLRGGYSSSSIITLILKFLINGLNEIKLILFRHADIICCTNVFYIQVLEKVYWYNKMHFL